MTPVLNFFVVVLAGAQTGRSLPPGAVGRLGTVKFRHPDSVRDAAFSPDGRRLAVTSNDGTLSIWDAATGRLVGRANAGREASVAYALDGQEVGTYDARTGLHVFDPDARAERRSADVPQVARTGRIRDQELEPRAPPALAPGLRWMAYPERRSFGSESQIAVADPTTGRTEAVLPLKHGAWGVNVAYSPDGRRLIVGDSESRACAVWVFDLTTKKVALEATAAGYTVALALSRDGGRAMAATKQYIDKSETMLKVWDVPAGTLLLDRRVRDWDFRSAALAPDGKTVAFQEEKTITLLDVATGRTVRTWDTRCAYGRLLFSPDGGRLAVASNGNALEVFDPATGGGVVAPGEEFDLNGQYIHPSGQLVFRPDGMVVARLAGENDLSVWNPRTGQRVESITLPPGGRYLHAVTPDGKRLIYSAGPRAAVVGEFRLWDRDRKADVATSTCPAVVGPRFAFTPDGRRLFLHPDYFTNYAPEWWELDPTTLARVDRRELRGPFSQGELTGRRFAAGGLRRFEGVVDAQNRLLGLVRQWDVTTGVEGAAIRWAPAETLTAAADAVGDVRGLSSTTVSDDGRWFGVAQFIGRRGPKRADNRDPTTGANYVCVFDAADGRERIRIVMTPDPGEERVSRYTPVLSPDGRLVAVHGIGGACRVYETASGTERRRVSGASGRPPFGNAHSMYAAAFSPDSKLLVTCSPADAALVWDLHAAAAFAGKDFTTAWDALATPSAEKAYPALVWLASRGDDAARFLAANLRPTPAPTAELVAEGVTQLGAPAYRDREAAEGRLRWVMGQHAARFEADLQKALKDTADPEVRQRLEKILAAKDRIEPLPEEVRAARGVEALERISTPAARAALAALADGPADAWLTRDAQAARDRLRREK